MVALGKPLDGRDGLSVMHHGQRQAGVDTASFDQHRAGTALTVIATLLRARHRQMLAQGIQQRGPWIERQRMRVSVDLKFDRYGSRWRPRISRVGSESCARKRGQQ